MLICASAYQFTWCGHPLSSGDQLDTKSIDCPTLHAAIHSLPFDDWDQNFCWELCLTKHCTSSCYVHSKQFLHGAAELLTDACDVRFNMATTESVVPCAEIPRMRKALRGCRWHPQIVQVAQLVKRAPMLNNVPLPVAILLWC
jgi:hypothetical protein